MRKQFLTALLILLSLCAMAQEGEQNIGFNAGFGAPTFRYKANASAEELSKINLYGAKAGMVYETTFIKGFGMQLGLNYTYGGNIQFDWKKDTKSTSKFTRESYHYHQIELTVDWQYKWEIAKQTYLLLYTGPTMQMGLGFKKNLQLKQLEPFTNKEIISKENTSLYKVDGDEDGISDYRRWNVTWGVGAGFQYKQYFLRGGYDFGIVNPFRDRYDNNAEYYRAGRFDQWSLKLGIYIWQFK